MSLVDYLRTFGRTPPASAESDSRFLALTEANAALVYVVEGGIIRYANRAARSRGGAKGRDLVGLRFSDLVHGDSRDALSQRMMGTTPSSVLSPQRFELKLDGPQGSEPWIDLTLSPIEHEGRPALLAMGFDITDRKLAESAMRESERRLRELIENIQLISVLLDARGDVTFANEYALELLGLHEEGVVGRNWFDLVVSLDRRSEMQEAFTERMKSGTVPHEEYEILTARGEPRVVSWNSTILRDPSGAVCGMASIGGRHREAAGGETPPSRRAA